MRLKDKIAVITGAGMGMGKATAIRFAAEGAKVMVHDIDPAAATETLNMINTRDDCVKFTGDVADSSAMRALFASVDEHYGRLDVLVNNAGIGQAEGDAFGLFMERMGQRNSELEQQGHSDVYADQVPDMEDRGWQRVIDVNVNGTFFTNREAVKLMIKYGVKGSIVNISSTSALNGEGAVHYCASKSAILGFTRSLATEVGARGIRVNAICPGPTRTRLMDDISDEWAQAMVQGIPIGRICEPEEVAATSLFLASDESALFTGQTLMANGGMHLL